MVDRGEITLHGVTYKYAGGLELELIKDLVASGVEFEYEPGLIPFVIPAQNKSYKPDFLFSNGIIVEGKGEFTSSERKKFKALKATYPDIDIRFVFSRPTAKIGKKSQTTYAMWCEREGFPYAAKRVPDDWKNEPFNKKRMAAARAAIKRKGK
jgi:hypothetical protein